MSSFGSTAFTVAPASSRRREKMPVPAPRSHTTCPGRTPRSSIASTGYVGRVAAYAVARPVKSWAGSVTARLVHLRVAVGIRVGDHRASSRRERGLVRPPREELGDDPIERRAAGALDDE